MKTLVFIHKIQMTKGYKNLNMYNYLKLFIGLLIINFSILSAHAQTNHTPQSIHKTTHKEVNVYKKGTIKNGWVNLKTDLKKGDKIEIIFKNGNKELLEILDVKADKFQVFTVYQGDIFVYANRIQKPQNDNKSVVLSKNSTQELEQKVKELKIENARLKATVQQLQMEITSYKTKDK